MVDYLALALSHGVLLLAFWRLAGRDDLDRDEPAGEPGGGDGESRPGQRPGMVRPRA